MRPFYSIKLLLILFCSPFSLASQAQYYFEKLTEENGLSDNRVTSILKDKAGFIWLGTKNGLNRYDGTSFKVFKPSVRNSISNESINDLVQDSSGNIWISTMNGLNIYYPQTDQWESINSVPTEPKQIPNNLTWDLEVDEKNNIWIVTDVWELSSYDPRKKKFTHYNWPAFKDQPVFNSLSRYRSIQRIKRKSNNEWWLATTIGLHSVEIASGKFKIHAIAALGTVVDLYYDKVKEKVFITNENGSLFCYDELTNVFREIKSVNQAYPATEWKKDRSKQSLILLAHPNGMMEIDPGNNTATFINYQPSLSPSLSPGGTHVIYKDNNGIIWVGTNRGINYYNSRNHFADFIPLTVASVNDNDDGMSAAVYDPIEKKYYISSLQSKELFIIDDLTGKISKTGNIDGKPLSACTNICIDRQKDLWLLTATHIYRYDREKRKFSLFPTPNGNRDVIFNDIILDKKGNYWLATWQDGVYHYDTKSKKFYVFTSSDSISAKNITALYNDPVENAVWIGTYNYGPYRYDLDKESFINYTETTAAPQYLHMTLIKDIEADTDGKLWFSSFGSGLHVFKRGQSYENAFTSISFKNGLPGSSYFALTRDNKHRLWLLSRQGLSAIDQDGKFLYEAICHPATGFANFAPGSSYTKRISFNADKNEILVPVAGGLLIYYPDEAVPSTPFPLVLTDITVDSVSVLHSPALIRNNNIEIPFRSNNLSVRFAALSFANYGSIQYEYKLQESDPTWKPAGTLNTLNFPRLSPGYYDLQIRARDASGNISANTPSFSFHILPPFWQSWWFIGSLVLVLAYLIYRLISYFRMKIKSQQIVNYFATSLYGQNTTEDVFWDVAKNCISQLKFIDCVVYLYDAKSKVLIQKAAYGPKNPEKHEIYKAIEIPLGKGIVGTVAQTNKAEIINDTSKDPRYIVDDERRYSEIAVPITVDKEIFGVIDSEHPHKRFFKKYHLRILKQIASICSDKVSKYIVQEKLRSKISRDLHDEIGSSLTSINVLSKVAISKAGEQTDIAGYLSKIKDTTSSTMESMSDMVWAINPKNDKLDAVMSRMREFAVDICEARGIELDFSLPDELENIPLDLDKRRNLFLIFKEAVNNAVKYSGSEKLIIRFEKKNGILSMIVQDKGAGFNESTVTSGNGLYNMHERATECGGNLIIESGFQKGTTVRCEIPSPDLG